MKNLPGQLVNRLSDLLNPENSSGERAKARELISRGWRFAYGELFGQSFVNVLDSAETDDKHHSEALEWHWLARLALIHYEIELRKHQKKFNLGVITFEAFAEIKQKLQAEYYPEFWAYMAIWARGNMKTTLARFMTIMDAVMSFAYDVAGYALIVGGTVKKVRGTAKTVSGLLQSDKIKEYAAPLSRVKKNEQGSAQGWTADFINTEAGYVFHFIGLDEGVAGANVENIRPTFIIPDDIDDREDSPVISDGRFNTLTRSVIPTKQWNTLFFFAQNLISRFAVLYRIYKQQVRVLANRYVTEPVPAVRNLVTEQRTIGGIVKDVFVSGEITWRGWDKREVQNQIDSMTLPIFLLECQHEVEQSKEGLVHKIYNDNVHPISYSQFAARFGSPDEWKYWHKTPFSDWSRTKTKYHANVAGYLAVSNQNSVLPGHTFVIPLSFPKDTQPADVAARLLSILTPYATESGAIKKTWSDLVDEAWKRMNEHEHFESVTDRLEYLKSYYSRIIPNYSAPVLKKYRVGIGANSHSEDQVRNIFNQGFGFSFVPSNPRETDALEDIDEAMRVDYSLAHLFDDEKKGYTRFHVLCRDDTTKPFKLINGVKVYPPVPYPDVMEPDNLHDEDLFRYQMSNRRYADAELTKTGEKVDVLLKLNDDFGQALQMVYLKKLLSNLALTKDEIKEEKMPEAVKQSVLDQMPDSHEKDYLMQRRRLEEKRLNDERNRKHQPPGMKRYSRR